MKEETRTRDGRRLGLFQEALERAAIGGPFSWPLIADGATGTVLASMSGVVYSRLALLPLEKPEYLRALHRAYLGAGADIIETATFMADVQSLETLPGRSAPASELAYRIGKAAASIALEEALHAEHTLGVHKWVAGSIGPGMPVRPGISQASQIEAYLPLVRGLADGGADFILIETINSIPRMNAVIEALAAPGGGRGIPFALSATVSSRGWLASGDSQASETGISDFVAAALPAGPLFIGLNCGAGPASLESALADITARCELPLSFMPSAGIPVNGADGQPRWPLSPDEFAHSMEGIIRRHRIAIAGGCCGTTPMHILKLSTAVRT